MIKVVAINGSPRKDGNTFHAIKYVSEELENKALKLKLFILEIGTSEDVLRATNVQKTLMINVYLMMKLTQLFKN